MLEDIAPKEKQTRDLLNIERLSVGQKGWDYAKSLDIETPGNWIDYFFLQEGARDKFLTRYILDFFKGKMSQFSPYDEASYDYAFLPEIKECLTNQLWNCSWYTSGKMGINNMGNFYIKK